MEVRSGSSGRTDEQLGAVQFVVDDAGRIWDRCGAIIAVTTVALISVGTAGGQAALH